MKRNEGISSVVSNSKDEFQITPNFSNAHKFGYMYKYSFDKISFVEKLFVLNKNGLLLAYDDANKPPVKVFKLKGCKISKVEEKLFKKKYCFELISEINDKYKESNIFAAVTEEEFNIWYNDLHKYLK